MSPALAQNTTDIQSLLENRLPTILQEADQIGNAGIVMHKGQVIAQSASGLRQKDGASAATTNDKWHIGSITKSMTATMIGRLADKGQIGFDDTIADLLPNQKQEIDTAWHNVKLIDLLHHTSGASANFGPTTLLNNKFQTQEELDEARRAAVFKILAKAPTNPPNTKFEYSNIGYTIAGTIAAKVTGKSWEELMRSELFAPLGLKSAGFGAPLGDQPWGHTKTLWLFTNPVDPAKHVADNTPIMGPAGTVHMSIEDLARFGQMHLQAAKRDTDYLSASTIERLHTASVLTIANENYAAGWVLVPLQAPLQGEALFHNGSNTMWYAFLAVLPQYDLVVAFATNTGTVARSENEFANLLKDIATQLKKRRGSNRLPRPNILLAQTGVKLELSPVFANRGISMRAIRFGGWGRALHGGRWRSCRSWF